MCLQDGAKMERGEKQENVDKTKKKEKGEIAHAYTGYVKKKGGRARMNKLYVKC